MAKMKTGADPGEHTVDEVTVHLETADDAERARVLEAERAGKARKTILGEDEAPAAVGFPADAAAFAGELGDWIALTREELREFATAQAEVTATHAGDVGHEQVAYQLRRVGSVFADVERALDILGATVTDLAGAAANV